MKKYLALLFFIVSVLLLIYIFPKSPDFPNPPAGAVQSDEPADVETTFRRGYYTNLNRIEVINYYKQAFNTGFNIYTPRLNYPPEDSPLLIRDQTKTTYLEELVHPLRESIYINGFEPKSEEYAQYFKGVRYSSKIIIRYVPSPIWVRVAMILASGVSGYFLALEYLNAKKEIDLSIIIISLSTEKYHTKDSLEITLRSIVPALKKINGEVILVDNTTINDRTLEMSKSYIPNIVYLKRNEVHGFGDNNNFGLKHAKGKYVLFLNNDVKILDDKIFEEMVDWMNVKPKVAVVSSALLNSDERTLQASGGAFPSLIKVISWMLFLDDLPLIDKLFDSYHPHVDYFKTSHNQDWVTGAFYLIRKEVLDEVGVFDEDYNAYVEETDLSYRIKNKGWEIWYMPKWKIIHFGGQSYGSENSLIFELKNLSLFYKKHYPSWQLPILNIVIKLGCILRILIFGLINPKLSKIYAKAIKTV